ncbi:transaldolase [Streptomyces sp. NBC_01619]|uniref:transaldolase family protein n=1 Tax=Streptomyces sp. NBC_01619 TaxID=2975901 RepID=UPI0022588E50|nr:transaldolase family protein [Streptomyces sp. NBC_01619]MCX4515885.1 transaldolase [Streptomyces sp. NBC_01619]
MTDAISRLRHEGVSVWLDDASKDPVPPQTLYSMIESERIAGLTSYPALLAHAHRRNSLDGALPRNAAQTGITSEPAGLRPSVADDVRRNCDLLLGVHRRTAGRDGYVTVNVDPRHAQDAARIFNAALAVHSFLDRPNILIGLPATDAGTRAMSECVANGIGVHATLVFSANRYRQVVAAYLRGLEAAHARGHALADIPSVASFHISELDRAVDTELTKAATPEAKAMMGRAGLAHARLAYEVYEHATHSSRWQKLATHGARTQRLLWHPTPQHHQDTHFVEELVAKDTIMNIPTDLLQAVTHHGQIVGDRVRRHYTQAHRDLNYLRWFGISTTAITQQLEQQALCTEQITWQKALNRVSPRLHQTPVAV